jgi:hypothetical protein
MGCSSCCCNCCDESWGVRVIVTHLPLMVTAVEIMVCECDASY